MRLYSNALEGSGIGSGRILCVVPANGAVAQEFLDPLFLLRERGIQVDVATPNGEMPAIEWVGRWMSWFEPWKPTRRNIGRLPEIAPVFAMNGRESALAEGYDGVLVPGGFGEELAGLIRSASFLELLRQMVERKKVIALECHSVVALCADPSLHPHKQVVCWPGGVEGLMGMLPGLGRYFMPFGEPVQDTLEKAGFQVQHSRWHPWGPHACRTGRWVTSVGPFSAPALVMAIEDALRDRQVD